MSECCMTREETYAKMEDNNEFFYELGLNDAWKAARKLVFMDYGERNKVLGYNLDSVNEIFAKCTASEAIEKLCKYEEQKKQANEIRVGDEVVNNNGDKGIVLCYYHETDSCGNYTEEWLVVYMSKYDVPQTVTKKRFKKTGKRYDVMSILKQMQEGEE